MAVLSLSEVLANRERAQREMIADHAQKLRELCMELVKLIDDGTYQREAEACMGDSCPSVQAVRNIIIEKGRRAYLVAGMKIATGRVRGL